MLVNHLMVLAMVLLLGIAAVVLSVVGERKLKEQKREKTKKLSRV